MSAKRQSNPKRVPRSRHDAGLLHVLNVGIEVNATVVVTVRPVHGAADKIPNRILVNGSSNAANTGPITKAPKTAAQNEIVTANFNSDLELLTTLWKHRNPPFDRDVVLTREVTQYLRKQCALKPSATRVGKLLTGAPFNGKAIHFRAGAGSYRGIVLWNQHLWVGAPGREVMAHIEGNGNGVDDPLLA